MRFTLLFAATLVVNACSRTQPPTHLASAVQTNSSSKLAIERAAAARLDAPSAPLSAMAQLGKKIFFDPRLSASGRMSCAFCHNPDDAYAPANSLAAQLGGPGMNRQGDRTVPSLTYLVRTPRFMIRPDTAIDPGEGGTSKAPRPLVPEGGMDWDGRAPTLPDQPSGPLFDPREMANRSGPALLAKVKHAPYSKEFIAVFGDGVFSSASRGLADVYLALTSFLTEDRSFHRYDSKFDYYLAGRAQLSAQELRGLKLFDDPKKGNCAACHLDKPTKNRLAPVFTDYQFEALGAPRNKSLMVNRDPTFFDEGLCGPVREDLAEQRNDCGLFKTPTLRNVATRHVFFHNGEFHSLEDVIRFYVERDTRPEKWFPRKANGTVEMFDDLPVALRANVDVNDAPFNRHRGDEPALNDQEVKDVIAFLKTLTDGYEGDANQTSKLVR
jgi:cytochrome c peroxidase